MNTLVDLASPVEFTIVKEIFQYLVHNALWNLLAVFPECKALLVRFPGQFKQRIIAGGIPFKHLSHLRAGEHCCAHVLSGPQVIKVERKVVHGSEQQVLARLEKSPSQTINTAYIERSNLDWWLWDAHLARKAPTVARSMRWLKAKFAICVACYNLIRPHETLSRGEDRIFRPKTPAMAASVADHQWTFSEQPAYPALCQ